MQPERRITEEVSVLLHHRLAPVKVGPSPLRVVAGIDSIVGVGVELGRLLRRQQVQLRHVLPERVFVVVAPSKRVVGAIVRELVERHRRLLERRLRLVVVLHLWRRLLEGWLGLLERRLRRIVLVLVGVVVELLRGVVVVPLGCSHSAAHVSRHSTRHRSVLLARWMRQVVVWLLLLVLLVATNITPTAPAKGGRPLGGSAAVRLASVHQGVPDLLELPALLLQLLEHLWPLRLGKLLKARLNLPSDPLQMKLTQLAQIIRHVVRAQVLRDPADGTIVVVVALGGWLGRCQQLVMLLVVMLLVMILVLGRWTGVLNSVVKPLNRRGSLCLCLYLCLTDHGRLRLDGHLRRRRDRAHAAPGTFCAADTPRGAERVHRAIHQGLASSHLFGLEGRHRTRCLARTVPLEHAKCLFAVSWRRTIARITEARRLEDLVLTERGEPGRGNHR